MLRLVVLVVLEVVDLVVLVLSVGITGDTIDVIQACSEEGLDVIQQGVYAMMLETSQTTLHLMVLIMKPSIQYPQIWAVQIQIQTKI